MVVIIEWIVMVIEIWIVVKWFLIIVVGLILFVFICVLVDYNEIVLFFFYC